jgi:hypothetical protein
VANCRNAIYRGAEIEIEIEIRIMMALAITGIAGAPERLTKL